LPVAARTFALPKVLFPSPGAGGVTVHYATIVDLIAMREASGRPKDVRRAAELRELALRCG
jgi:hypothetical protein